MTASWPHAGKRSLVEPRKDPEGEGKREKTEREQGGQAGRHAKDLDAENTPSTSKPGRYVFAEAPATTRPPKQVFEEHGASFKQTLPVCRRPPVLTPTLCQSEHPDVCACCRVMPFVVKRSCRS